MTNFETITQELQGVTGGMRWAPMYYPRASWHGYPGYGGFARGPFYGPISPRAEWRPYARMRGGWF
jgi:hypothetical protein